GQNPHVFFFGQQGDRSRRRWFCGGRQLSERRQPFEREFVVRIQRQHLLKAKHTLAIVGRDAAEPQPGRLVLWICPHRLAQQIACSISPPLFRGGDPLAQKHFSLVFCHIS